MMASDAVLDVDDGCPFYSNLTRCWRWLAFSMYMDGNSVYFAVLGGVCIYLLWPYFADLLGYSGVF
jgi:hypothetical protein